MATISAASVPEIRPLLPESGNRSRTVALTLANVYRRYHRHRVDGLARLERAAQTGKPVLLVSNHVLEILDPMMFAAAVDERLGRQVHFIGHETLFFTLPGVRDLARAIGGIPSRHFDLAERVLRDEGVLMLYPGAGTEASLRTYRREPYRLKWFGRTGFVRLALRTGATILFVAGVGIDEMYAQTRWRIPDRLFDLPLVGSLDSYRGLRLQLGVGGPHVFPGVWPLPVRITHRISRPIPLDRSIDPEDEPAVATAQLEIWARCQRMLDGAVARRERYSDPLDRFCRRVHEGLGRLVS